MASEIEIERLLVRLIGDASSYHKMTQQAEQDTRRMEGSVNRDMGRIGRSMHGSLRSVYMLTYGFREMLNAKGPEQIVQATGRMALGIGRSFGKAGLAVGAGVSIITALLGRLNKEFDWFGESAKSGAGKALSGFLTGVSGDIAIADAKLGAFKKKMQEAGEGAMSRSSRFWAGSLSKEEYIQQKLNQGMKDQIEIEKMLGQVMDSNAGKIANSYNTVLEMRSKAEKSLESAVLGLKAAEVPDLFRKGQQDIFKAREELNKLQKAKPELDMSYEHYRSGKFTKKGLQDFINDSRNWNKSVDEALRNVDSQKKAAQATIVTAFTTNINKLRERRQDFGLAPDFAKARHELEFLLKNANQMPDALGKAKEQLAEIQATAVHTTLGKFGQDIQYAGMKPHERQAEKTIDSYQVTDKAIQNVLRSEAKWADAKVTGKESLARLTDEVRNYGMSAAQVAARDLDAVGEHQLANNLRTKEQEKAYKDLSKEVDIFNLTMAGATKSQLAFANAADPVAGELARQRTLLQEGMRVTQENLTPAEKFNQSHRELSDLLAHNTISQETYNRAIGKSAQQLNGVSQAIQGVGVNSADAFGKLLAYQDTINATNNLPAPLPMGNATVAGSAEAGTKQEGNRLLQLILNELLTANKKPPLQINAANFGGGQG